MPGQETRNSDYVLENGAGVKVHNLPTLAHKLTRLLDEPARLQRMKAAARRPGRRRAAFDVARAALECSAFRRRLREKAAESRNSSGSPVLAAQSGDYLRAERIRDFLALAHLVEHSLAFGPVAFPFLGGQNCCEVDLRRHAPPLVLLQARDALGYVGQDRGPLASAF